MNRIYNILSSILGDSKQGGFDKSCMQYQFNCRSCEEEKGVNENKYNLEVNLEMGKCHCWACDFKGPISRIIKKWGTKEQLQDYYNIIQDLKNSRYNEIGLFKDSKDANNGYQEDFLRLPPTFTKIDLNKLRKRKLSEYLAKRKINQEIIDFYNLGYTTWDEKNWQDRDRLIIPSYDNSGSLNYWVGRDFSGNQYKTKYKNCNRDKNAIIFNEDKILWDADIWLCEGAIDCIYGNGNFISLLGKKLTRNCELYKKIRNFANADITICLDGDTLIDETKRIYNLLNTGRLRNRIWYLRLGTDSIPYKDFGEIFENEGKRGLINALKQRKQFSEIELLI